MSLRDIPPTILARLAALALLGLALAGCGRVDGGQARLCERATELLFSDRAIEAMTSAADPAAPHGIVVDAALRGASGGERRRVTCRFAGGTFSPERLTLTGISRDPGGRLDDVQMAILIYALGREHPAQSFLGALPAQIAPALSLPVGASVLYFLQQLVNGIMLGCVIALIATGYTLVYSIIGAINFAFGELYMIGAFTGVIGVVFFTMMGVGSFVASVLLALLATMALNAGYSWATERLVFRPLRPANSLMPLIAAIGLSIVLQNYVFVTQGARDVFLPPIAQGGIVLAEADGFSLYVNREQAVVLAVTLLLAAATWYLLARTPFGRAQRASSQDKGMAALVGINIDRVIAATFALGGALAAAGGLMVASYYGGVNFVMGFLMGFKALTAAIVGGMGSFAGALLGGFIVAFVETFWAGYLQVEYRDIAVFTLLIVLLVFRPQGLLGTR
jgi:branched-chain amino acid transport system permease protein